MPTAFFSHPECMQHQTGADHPESAARLAAISDRLLATGLGNVLLNIDAPEASRAELLRVHDAGYVDALYARAPKSGLERIDPDTVIGPRSLDAARRAAGAAIAAVDLVASGEVDNAFCSVRPPGHHAERNESMGFCLFNNVAVGAAHALEAHGYSRIAILDFDVHHGNGTENIFADDERVLFCSSFQHPFYPFTPLHPNTANRVSVPLGAGDGSDAFRDAVERHWMPAVARFEPEFVFVSAGFDAHVADDMSHIHLVDDDYQWVTERIVEMATATAEGRIVSTLEGGYELHSLARCVATHLRVLAGVH